VFGFVAHQCVPRVPNGLLVVFRDVGNVGDWDALDLTKQEANVTSFACCVSRRIVLSLARGLDHACLLFDV
jgi:hypothetical protein